MTSNLGWPWGENRPTAGTRVVVASLIAIVCGLWVALGPSVAGTAHTDFGQVWFGATAMLQHRNPYDLVGPGREFEWEWSLFYPGTSLALAIPLTWMKEDLASAVFIMISTWLLVFGATRASWHRLPAFASAAFVIAVRAGQWSPLMTAGWFIPGVAAAWMAKPTLGLAFFLSAPTMRHRYFAVCGGVALLAISVFYLPSWPWDWTVSLKGTSHMVPPLLQPAGFLILVALSRWKRREALVLTALAFMPQSPSIYEALPVLLLIPQTYREASGLSIASSIGAFLMLMVPEMNASDFVAQRGMLLVATTYLPALILILRRPNEVVPASVGAKAIVLDRLVCVKNPK